MQIKLMFSKKSERSERTSRYAAVSASIRFFATSERAFKNYATAGVRVPRWSRGHGGTSLYPTNHIRFVRLVEMKGAESIQSTTNSCFTYPSPTIVLTDTSRSRPPSSPRAPILLYTSMSLSSSPPTGVGHVLPASLKDETQRKKDTRRHSRNIVEPLFLQ